METENMLCSHPSCIKVYWLPQCHTENQGVRYFCFAVEDQCDNLSAS